MVSDKVRLIIISENAYDLEILFSKYIYFLGITLTLPSSCPLVQLPSPLRTFRISRSMIENAAMVPADDFTQRRAFPLVPEHSFRNVEFSMFNNQIRAQSGYRG